VIDRVRRVVRKGRDDDSARFDDPIAPEVHDVDAPRDYDVDIAIAGADILERAALAGVRIREHGTRTARLTRAELDALGLGSLESELSAIARHDVKFVIVKDVRHAKRLGLNILLRR
jgi:hypothetical protein